MVRWRAALLSLALLGGACGDPTRPSQAPPFAHGDVDVPNGATRLSFSPDGKRFAYVGGGFLGTSHVAVVEDGRPRKVTPPDVEVSGYAWMPDSASFLVAHGPLARDDLSVFDLKGRQVRAIDLDVAIEIQGGLTVRADGKVAVVAAEAPSIMTEPSDLLEVDLDTGRTRPLLSTPDIDESEPVFVGEQIVIEEWPRVDAPRRPGYVSLFDPSTGRVERRTPDGMSIFGFAPSPDGRFFVLDASTHGRQDRMYRAVPTEGGEPVPLHDGAGAFALHPSGTRLVIATTNAPYRLYSVDIEWSPG